VNLSTLTVTEEPAKKEYLGLGGRGLVARVLRDEVDPTCDPLGPENKLVLCTSALAGLGLSSSSRLSVGCKSPLTGGIKEANSGGTVPFYLARHGIQLVIIEGAARGEGPWVVRVDARGRASLEEAPECREMNNYELVARLRSRYGPGIAVASIGAAGERCYRNAAVMVTEYGTDYPCRAAARGGVGAVMGAKGVKAVVVEKPETPYSAPVADPERLAAVRRELHRLMAEGAKDHELRQIGTVAAVLHHAEAGQVPVRNFSGKRLEGLEGISGERFREIASRRGKTGLPCQSGCILRCANLLYDQEGRLLTAGLEYETVALCGANCGITDLEAVARLDYLCDDLGIDTIETGATIALCMEAGRIPWGDAKAAAELIREMMAGTEFGRVLGQGAEAVGRYLGVERIPVAKHQAMAGYDPRGAPITAVAYATSPMGADHTTAPSFGVSGDVSPEEICNLSRNLQILFATWDNLFCALAAIFWGGHLDKLAALYAAAYGGPAEPDRLLDLGRNTIRWEKEFNRAAGWTEADDVLPEFFYREKSEVTGTAFNIPPEVMRGTLKGLVDKG
jgi:aldehyde:ferredoxin oxidoreductase